MRRELTRYQNDNGGELYAHTVTDETAGPVTVVGGTGYDAKPGDVLVATERPDVYQVPATAVLDGYSAAESADTDSEVDQGSHDFDPDQYSAVEVHAYLTAAREAGNRTEFDRVTAAEVAGRNRSTALAGEFDR